MAAGPQRAGVPGFLDPRTGVFTSRPAVVTESGLAATTYNGTLTLKFAITLKTGIPADWPILCTQASSIYDVSGLYYSEEKTVKATRNGGTAACTVTVYYAWSLTSANDMISTAYTVAAYGDSSGIQQRQTFGNLADVQLPANGGTLTRTVNVTF